MHSLRKNKPNTPNTAFLDDVKALRSRLVDPSNPKFIFQYFDSKYNLPLKDLPELSQNVWKAIIE